MRMLVPTFLYGSETLTRYENDKLRAVGMDLLRRACGAGMIDRFFLCRVEKVHLFVVRK